MSHEKFFSQTDNTRFPVRLSILNTVKNIVEYKEINIFERKDGIQNDPIASSIRLTSDAYQPPPQRLLENDRELARRDTAQVSYLSLRSLLPDTNGYMTYEGSTTHPGCWETAVWLILNKPIYITAQELYALRKLMQGPASAPKAPLGNNSRPLQDLHHRTIRTNINFRKRPDAKCPTMAQDMHYRANAWRDDRSLSHNVV
ncbi:hypothetical protein HZH68_005819 [Vespula germanica]|uniref:Alpha-carbonic anhydrase domain-containing protein n=1 Tax=Vespula germanica TaxID=30212 RepID=A0A834KGY5_VESGE|nr:hypothetical protein HZH68_005819 [Vespula germanica]